ncbi:MAG: periplasmic heavy metal sensor [Cyclobacteriaceae bacterium]|nr:periplasmic heavy metal sensor [Cyclobacteriaceae bacterium]
MNYIDKSRFMVFMIVALVLLNLGTLGVVFMNRPPHGGPGPGRSPEGPGMLLMDKVGFTEEQRAAYRLLMDEHRNLMHSSEDSIRFYKEQLFSYLPASNSTSAELSAVAISRLQKKIEMTTFDHFVKVRALCTPDQATKFDAIIQEVLKMMAPPKGPGQGPGPGKR